MKSMYITRFVCYMAYAYNRKCVALSMPKMIEEGLDTSHAGLILSCQNIAISGSKLLFGMLSDRLNPLRLFASGLLLTGLVTLLFSSSSSVPAFCVFWFLNGLAQGCGWPSLSKILRQRADPTKFGTLWSFLSSSNNISGCLSPFLTTYLALNYGWRYSLYTAGISSVLLSAVPMFLMNSSNENNLKSTSNQESSSAKDKSCNSTMTVYDLLKDSFLWLVFVCFLVAFCAKSTLVDWGQLYMKQDCGLSLTHGSVFASSVEIGGFVGRLSAGYLTDIFVTRTKANQGKHTPSFQVRMTVAVGFLLGSVFALHAFRTLLNADSTMMTIMCLGFSSGAFLYGTIAICGIVASESAPPHLSGSAYAIAATGGNIGSTMSGLPICYLATRYSWSNVLLLLEIVIGITLILVICFKNIRSTTSSSKKDD